jgi:type IV pilus assembly protein PilF
LAAYRTPSYPTSGLSAGRRGPIFLVSCGLAVLMALWGCVDSKRVKDQANAQMRLGESMLKEGRSTQALTELTKAVELDPDNAQIRNVLGVAYLDKGMYPEAVREFKKALNLDPEFVDVHNNLGTALLQQGKVQEAIVEFNLALKSPLYPTPQFVQFNLGQAYYLLKDYEQSRQHYLAAIKIAPSYSLAYNGLGMTYTANGQWNEASEALKKAIEYAPKYAEAHYNLGEVLMAQNQVPLARLAFREVVRLDPEGPYGRKAKQRLKEIP